MSTATTWGWRILVTVASLLVINGIGLYILIADTHIERTIGLVLAGFAALALAVAIDGLRGGKAAWSTSWIVAATLAGIGLHSLRSDRVDLVVLYLALAAITAAALVLARPGRSAP